ncbi:hypothetical protein [Leptolyngbya sp. PCC 6406]|uniref:hypothetical protein n=1 Tax=Leptolyngbya sp. PCC 6406 TaxID=1173264 RepID=UPI0002AC93FD|nr:hypothetical protein [Leptolyngbya sp. PCC 6406]
MTLTATVLLAPHQRRLRAVVKQLVIDLAHLEHCLAAGLQDGQVKAAAADLDAAIDRLNDYLARDGLRPTTGHRKELTPQNYHSPRA